MGFELYVGNFRGFGVVSEVSSYVRLFVPFLRCVDGFQLSCVLSAGVV